MNFFAQQNLLALPSTDVPLVYQHNLSHLVTSLPYIDADIDSQAMAQAQKLIQDEMKIMPKKDYLANLRLKDFRSSASIYLESELERIKNGVTLDAVDPKAYNPENLLNPQQQNDLNSLKAAKIKADGLSQHNNFKLINLELLNKYGAASWKDYLNDADTFTKNKEKEANSMKYAIDELNAKRKFEQFQTKDKMDELQQKIHHMLQKNNVLEAENDKLENEIRDIRFKKLKNGR